LEKLFEKEDYQRKDEIQKTRKELEKLELRKSKFQNDLMDRTITPHDCTTARQKRVRVRARAKKIALFLSRTDESCNR